MDEIYIISSVTCKQPQRKKFKMLKRKAVFMSEEELLAHIQKNQPQTKPVNADHSLFGVSDRRCTFEK